MLILTSENCEVKTLLDLSSLDFSYGDKEHFERYARECIRDAVREAGLRTVARCFRKLGQPIEDAIEDAMERFEIPRDVAEAAIRHHWKMEIL